MLVTPPTLSVQRRLGAPGAMQRPDHGEGREVDALSPQPGAPGDIEQQLDHVAPRSDEDNAGPRSAGRLDGADDVVLQHGVLERHRNVILSLEANGRSDLLAVGHRRQIERAHDDLLVRYAEPDLP